MPDERIIYCHCAYSDIIPEAVKNEVLRRLTASGRPFEVVADLCEMSARGDPAVRELDTGGPLKIAACFPRAVKWLFEAAGHPLADDRTEVRNMREESAEDVVLALLGSSDSSADGTREKATKDNAEALAEIVQKAKDETSTYGKEGWVPWFPVIDRDRCTDCMQCLSFCLFDVYGVDADSHIRVANPRKCKTSCPACARLCPEMAIIFPKYEAAPLNGAEVNSEGEMNEPEKLDISSMLGGNVYQKLRDRRARAERRFSSERDEDAALQERMRCFSSLQERLDIPAEVLEKLPTVEQIRVRAEAARCAAQRALRERETKDNSGPDSPSGISREEGPSDNTTEHQEE